VSKSVRKETVSVYYLSQIFKIYIAASEVSQVYAWTKSVSKQLDGQRVKINMEIACKGNLHDLAASRKLLALACDPESRVAIDMTFCHASGASFTTFQIGMYHEVRRTAMLLREVIGLGLEAKKAGYSKEHLGVAFRAWVAKRCEE
jgi:hypothetical protein